MASLLYCLEYRVAGQHADVPSAAGWGGSHETIKEEAEPQSLAMHVRRRGWQGQHCHAWRKQWSESRLEAGSRLQVEPARPLLAVQVLNVWVFDGRHIVLLQYQHVKWKGATSHCWQLRCMCQTCRDHVCCMLCKVCTVSRASAPNVMLAMLPLTNVGCH